MISQETMDRLKSIGLNMYERKIYAALLAKGVGNAGELAELAQIPRSRAYDVLESLAEKGFVVVQHAKPLRYVALSPSVAMEKTKDILREKMQNRVSRIDSFSKSDALKELGSLFSQGVSLVEPADLSGAFKGSYAVNLHTSSLMKRAQESIDIMTTAEGLNRLWDVHGRALRAAARAGVRIRIVAPLTEDNARAAEILGKTAEVKDLTPQEHAVPSSKMVVVDGSQVLLGLTGEETHPSQETSFWSASDHFSTEFAKKTFDMVWAHL